MNLKLNSATKEVGRIRVPVQDVSSYHEFNESDGGLRMSEYELMLISWADKAFKELKHLKNSRATELVEEYEDVMSDVLNDIENRTLPEKYRVLTTYSGKSYLVTETIEEIENQMHEIHEEMRLGLRGGFGRGLYEN